MIISLLYLFWFCCALYVIGKFIWTNRYAVELRQTTLRMIKQTRWIQTVRRIAMMEIGTVRFWI